MAEIIFIFYWLIDVGNVLQIPPLLEDSSSEHVAHHDDTLRWDLLSLLRLNQLLPFYALSDILLVDWNISLRELGTIARVFDLLGKSLVSKSLGLVKLSKDDDGFDVIWHFSEIDSNAFIRIDLFFWEAKISL
jgi:hypothetical protein